MMVTQRPRRTREVTGPTPHSVALFARPANKRPPEQLILDRRQKEEQRQQVEELTKYNKLCDLKNDWEKATDRKIQINTVKRRVHSLMQQHQFSIEDRRDRLRDLLSREEEQYLEEMAAKEETVIERQASMRARAKALREKREEERMEVVQEKLEQQWREQCEELRSTASKRQQDIVAAERLEQLRIKADMEDADKKEEQMFADLWYADMAAKAQREEHETQRQMSANQDMLNILQKQMAALEAQKLEEKKLKEEEAELLKQQAELRKLEDQQALEEKRRRAVEARTTYDRSLKAKAGKEAKELQEQLAFDMKILEQLLEESHNEAMEQAQRKKELREEDRRYRKYLEAMKAEEREREEDLESLCDAEVEKMWQKKLAQWRLEREARQKLLEDVLASRRIQVEEKLRENERRLREAEKEQAELLRKIEQNKRLEREQKECQKQQHLAHQNDLIHQMGYNRRQREIDSAEEESMWRSQREAEFEYQRKLNEALANPDLVQKMHPMRRAITQRNSAGSVRDGFMY